MSFRSQKTVLYKRLGVKGFKFWGRGNNGEVGRYWMASYLQLRRYIQSNITHPTFLFKLSILSYVCHQMLMQVFGPINSIPYLFVSGEKLNCLVLMLSLSLAATVSILMYGFSCQGGKVEDAISPSDS